MNTFTASRDFVRSIPSPLLIAPDDVPAHPYKAAMEVASLAANAEVTIYPRKDSQEPLDEVVEQPGVSSSRTNCSRPPGYTRQERSSRYGQFGQSMHGTRQCHVRTETLAGAH